MSKEMKERVERLRDAKNKALLGGGLEKIERHHHKGKLTARERIDYLLDPESFVEFNLLAGHAAGNPGDGILTGYGTINGKTVCLYAQDATVLGGSIGVLHGYKMYKTVERALDMGVPVIGLLDSPGARAPKADEPWMETSTTEKSGSAIFFPNTEASGVIPQIAGIMGSCAGISVYSPALMDFIFMVDDTSHMFITGPRVAKSVTYEDISMDDLGGAKVHCQLSGVADLRAQDDKECLEKIKKLLSFLPSNCNELSPIIETDDDPARLIDEFEDIVPDDPAKPYDMHKVILLLVDNEDFYEIKAEFAPEIIVGFGRLAGQTIGIVANQPMSYGGALTINSSRKQARFIRICDSFNIPIILLVDTPAYAPGSEQEHGGIICHGAKVLYALCEAVVPRIGVILHKCYGGGGLGMGVAPGLGTDIIFAWPSTEFGVMGAKETVLLFYGAEIAKSNNPQQLLEQKVKEYSDNQANILTMTSTNPHIADVIEPRDTRKHVIMALKLLRGKKQIRYPKRHGNIPL